jgi:lipid II:glycine glycyltransferase (peptidoglycan interpeptide bridge formation enzyme)
VHYGEKAGWQSIEMRGGEKLPQRWPRYAGYYGHSLDLHSSEESLLSNIKDSTRRNIRKAQREEVTVSMSNVPEATEEFYRLNCITRKAHGLPPQPAHFFKKIQEHILSKDHGIIALARHKGRAIAAAVYFQFGKRIMYKYGASDRHYLQKRPNDLVMWEAIKWSRSQGYDSLCFGRTEPENEGLRAFKNGWGTEEKIIPYAFYDVMQKRFMAGSTTGRTVSAAIMRRMPIPFLKFIGEALYRHMG